MIKKRTKGAIELSFGIIFSVILIAVFLFVAFIAIRFFLNMQCTISQGTLVKDLNDYVYRLWTGSGTEISIFESSIGGFCGVNEICFINPDLDKPQQGAYKEEYEEFSNNHHEGDNLFFYPRKAEEFGHVPIEHLNLEGLNPNPYCIKFESGKIKIRLRKSSQEGLVRVVT